MGKPAARIGDMHTCPLSDGPKPHVGGPIITGFPTVIVGGSPAARMSDTATCVGPPDAIVMGSPTVHIGGQFAARIGDPSVHGGVITTGFPTVLIGEAASAGGTSFSIGMNSDGTVSFGNSITVSGSLEFQSHALGDLMTLASLPSGVELLNSIESSGHNVTVTECGTGNDGASDGPWSSPDLYNGNGMDANVEYNPNQTPMYGNGSDWDNPPTAVTLGHELTHASHITNGNLPGDPTSGPTVPNDPTSGLPMNRALEERRTMGIGSNATHGLPDYSNEPFSENTIRQDMGEPERTTYLDPDSGMW
jgi:uncharacterized Zn-binding protein involved in type VI secretion